MDNAAAWPQTAEEARAQLASEPGYRAFDITGGRLYGETDQGWHLLWAPDDDDWTGYYD